VKLLCTILFFIFSFSLLFGQEIPKTRELVLFADSVDSFIYILKRDRNNNILRLRQEHYYQIDSIQYVVEESYKRDKSWTVRHFRLDVKRVRGNLESKRGLRTIYERVLDGEHFGYNENGTIYCYSKYQNNELVVQNDYYYYSNDSLRYKRQGSKGVMDYIEYRLPNGEKWDFVDDRGQGIHPCINGHPWKICKTSRLGFYRCRTHPEHPCKSRH